MATVSAASSLPPFLNKTYEMVDDPKTDAVVSWSNTNDTIVVWDVREFTRELLPKYFKHNNFSSFVRQLNTYGFKKVHPDRWEFANEGFLRGHKHLLKNISRRKPSHAQDHEQHSQVQSSSDGSSIEAGKFGIEEEVEKLKKDKNVLGQELVRLRQQQQSTDLQFQTVGQRVHVMEQHQQQMMSFLAKAMQKPGFIAQLFHQPNESKMHKSGGNKKRRFPNQDEENLTRKLGIASPDGQIVKYRPLMNEAAKAMLQQILKMSASGRIESKFSNINGFLMDNMHPPSNVLDNSSSPNRMSGVTLSEVLPSYSQSLMAADSVFPFNRPSSALSKIHSSSSLVNGKAQGTLLPEIDMALPEFSQVNPEKNVNLPDTPFDGTGSEDMEYMDAMPGSVDGPMPVASDGFSSDPDVDVLVDEIPKLPGINDVFWEQFLSSSPVTGDMDKTDSSTFGGGIGKEEDQQTAKEGEWDKMTNMSNLTVEMGLLASASKSG